MRELLGPSGCRSDDNAMVAGLNLSPKSGGMSSTVFEILNLLDAMKLRAIASGVEIAQESSLYLGSLGPFVVAPIHQLLYQEELS